MSPLCIYNRHFKLNILKIEFPFSLHNLLILYPSHSQLMGIQFLCSLGQYPWSHLFLFHFIIISLRYNWHTINSTYFKCAVWQVLPCETIITLKIVDISITPKVSYASLWSIPPAKVCSLLGNPDLLSVTIGWFAFSWNFM